VGPAPLPGILVVDDDALMRAFLRDALRGLPAQVREARDGEEALAAAAAEPPRVVLLDLMMPRRSGLEVLGALRRLHPGTRVLVVSSLDAELLVQQALSLGAHAFLRKPCAPEQVAHAVRDALAP
jgi:two-component system chemotaxis response regulator CheY